MNPIFQNIRIGRNYQLLNYGERTTFKVIRRISDTNFLAKNLLSLEKFELAELVQFGIGKDFELHEIDK